MRRIGIITVWGVLGVMLVLIGGCATKTVEDILISDIPPADFSVAVTVYGPEQDPTPIHDRPRPLRPSRYIVEPDGVLRASLGHGSAVDTFPPRTRQLTTRQMDQLWRAVRETGLVSPDDPHRIEHAGLEIPNPHRTTAVVYIAYGGFTRFAIITIDTETDSAVATRLLIDRLAALAWVRPLPSLSSADE